MSDIFLDQNPEAKLPKRDCHFYNWGGNYKTFRPNYPKELGSRCEWYKKFFVRESKTSGFKPSCYDCPRYERV